MESAQSTYYLQVVPVGESPVWPVDEAELNINSQEIEGGLMQFWAYPKSSGLSSSSIPHAQVLASQVSTPRPVILIDQIADKMLELVLVKSGIAYGKTESNLDNLEDNLSEILDYGKNKFNIKIDNFMTTSRVTPEIEQKLDSLEGSENVVSEADEGIVQGAKEPEVMESNISDEEDVIAQGSEVIPDEIATSPVASRDDDEKTDAFQNIKGADPSKVFRAEPTLGGLSPGGNKKSSNLLTWILILVLLAGLGGAGFLLRDKITSMFVGSETKKEAEMAPAPTPTPEATPEPVARADYSVRVLNGTTTTGLAAELSDSLKEIGWKTLPVGNSTDKNVAQTLVKVKAGQDQLANQMITDLSSDYEASRGADLKSSDSADVEVVIGKK